MPIRQEGAPVPITGPLMAALTRSLSPARLAPYAAKAGRNNDAKAIALYLWNSSLSQSLHYPLEIAELTLRNSIVRVFETEFSANWFNEPRFQAELGPRYADLLKAQTKAVDVFSTRRPSIDQIISCVMFGFWVSMLQPQFNPNIWSKHLNLAFPRRPASLDRQGIYKRAALILDLRNCIMHHEVLLSRNLSHEYSLLREFLHWLCPETKDWVHKSSSFGSVLRARPQ